MTDEEKKEIEELRKFKEAHVASVDKKENKETKRKSSSEIVGILACILFLVFGIYYCSKSPNHSDKDRSEIYSDNSSYHQILAKNHFKDYIKKNLKDPSSYDEISYTSNYNDYRKCYVVDLRFRAKNSFGGYTIERYIGDVTLAEGSVSVSNISKLE